jgi:hypothetical protein
MDFVLYFYFLSQNPNLQTKPEAGLQSKPTLDPSLQQGLLNSPQARQMPLLASCFLSHLGSLEQATFPFAPHKRHKSFKHSTRPLPISPPAQKGSRPQQGLLVKPHGTHFPWQQSKLPSQILLPQQGSFFSPHLTQRLSKQLRPVSHFPPGQQNFFSCPQVQSSEQKLSLGLSGLTQHC